MFYATVGLAFTYFIKIKLMVKKLVYIYLAILSSATFLNGQDVHFSQFSNAPTNINPALTGIFRGNLRASANFRSQWNSVPVDYLTFSGQVDGKLSSNRKQNSFLALGAGFNYDQAGYGNLSWANINISGSYTQRLSSQAFLTGGLQVGYSGRSYDINSLRFLAQYDRSLSDYNPLLDNEEDLFVESIGFFDIGAGLNFRLQNNANCEILDRLEKRNFLDLGIGVFHLARPDQRFLDATPEAKALRRYSPYLFTNWRMHEAADLLLNLSAQFQGKYQELLLMGGGRIYLDRSPENQMSIAFLAGYRFNNELGDVVYPGLELRINRMRLGFTYDVNVSDFNVATRRRGGPEFSLSYIIQPVCVSGHFCPLL